MTALTFLRRSLRHYWRTHIGVVLGAALGAMVLTGALLVGDSVKATLRRQALLRVGQIQTLMTGGDRFFREALAQELDAVPAVLIRGSITQPGKSALINQAQVLGVTGGLGALAPGKSMPALPPDGVGLNERAATQLGVRVGDTVIVRVEKPSAFSRDAPLSGEESELISIRAKVAAILSDEQFGRFSLQASQVPPFTVFVPMALLQQKLGIEGRANVLVSQKGAAAGVRDGFAQRWQLADASIELREVPKAAGIELRTDRVFLDPPVVAAAPRGVDSLTYLVNELRAGDKAAPYSMVTAIDAPSSGFLPAELSHDEIAISQWLAEDLGVREGAKIALKYYVMGERRELVEKSREFTVLAVIPQDEPQLNASWMPDFPGLADAQNCRDWQPGFDLDESKIRDKDEAYWDQYKGTPKAFLNIAVGQEMWGNRWGNLTSIRYPAGTKPETIAAVLKSKLTPEQLGFRFLPLREQALAATDAPVDFGQLFAGFSFFLLIAAAVLTGLLFVFSIEQRREEAGTLLALGLRPRQVRRLFLSEGAVLATIGALVGVAAAAGYTHAVLRALATVWSGAVGAVEFQFAASAISMAIGAVASIGIALLAMWMTSRRQLRHSARELMSGGGGEESAAAQTVRTGARPVAAAPLQARRGPIFWCGVAAVIVALGIALSGGGNPGAFFGAGGLLLLGGVAFALHALRARAAGSGGALASIGQLGTRNAARRRGRSVATIAVLASGVFMVVAVDSFRKGPVQDASDRQSGTGGFALVAESALPIYEDLNTAKGRAAFALDDQVMQGVSIVPMRVREGDDASCLNLNRALQPRLLGVKPGELETRRAFRFADGKYFGDGEPETTLPLTPENWWPALDGADFEDAVPGITDANTLQWALQKKLGDVLEYKDERGATFRVRIVATVSGSILQGDVVISETRLVEKVPGSGGYRFFLIDAPAEKAGAVAEHLSRALGDRGFEVTPAARRLAEFQAVENTYLSIFQALGGLGLLLGSAGLAIVVARNVLERRREFGLLAAVGFRPRQLRQLVFAEHRWLIVCGLAIGVASALVAVWPSLLERAGGFPWKEMALLLVTLTVGALFWTWLATRLALRGQQLDALRSE